MTPEIEPYARTPASFAAREAKLNETINKLQADSAKMPTDPWTGRPYEATGVSRIYAQLLAAHKVLDEADQRGDPAEETVWRLKHALGRIATA